MATFVRLDRIRPNPWQPRQGSDDTYVQALAEDIQARAASRPDTKGLLQLPAGRIVDDSGKPISPIGPLSAYVADGDLTAVLSAAGAFVQLAYGHNRYAAFCLLADQASGGLGVLRETPFATLPVAIVTFSDEEMATAAWAENEARKDLTPWEEASAINKMIADFGWTQEAAAQQLHLNRSTVANKLRLLKLPEQARDQLRRGQLSERQALALLPLAELPAAAIARAEQGYGTKPSTVLKDASRLSSDVLRNQVESVVHSATRALKEARFVDQVFEGDQRFRAPQCSRCPVRVKRGDEQRCADPACFELKDFTWQTLRLKDAAAATGIQAIGKLPDYNEYESFYSSDDKLAPAIVAGGCAQLRLCLKGYGYHPEGFDDVAVICVHAAGAKCKCLLAQRAEQRKTDPAELRKKEQKEQAKAIVAPAIDAFAQALADGQVGAWRKLIYKVCYRDYDKSAEWDIDRIRHALAAEIIKSPLSTFDLEEPDRARSAIVKLFGEANLPLPWQAATLAEELTRRLARITGWIHGLRNERPAPQAVRGNMTNLDDLFKQIDALPNEAVDARRDLTRAILQARETLQEVLPVLEGWDGAGLEEVRGVLGTPSSDLNFTAALERMPAPAVRYALALVRGEEYSVAKAALLERRIRKLERERVCAQTPADAVAIEG